MLKKKKKNKIMDVLQAVDLPGHGYVCVSVCALSGELHEREHT